MTTDNLSTESGELETPAIAQAGEDASDTELETATGEGEVETETEKEPVEEEDELDFGFKKYRVPKSLKENVEKLQATFTQKTQATASERKALDDERARIVEQAKASEEEMGLRVNLRQIDSQLEAYGKWTAKEWQDLKDENPQGWNEHRFHIQALRDARGELTGKITQAETTRTQEAQTAASKRIEQAEAYAASKGWKPDKLNDAVQFALDRGTKEHKLERTVVADWLHSNMGPLLLDVIELGRLGAEVLEERKAAARKKPTDPQPTAEPLTMVGAKKNPLPAGLDDKLPMDEWIRRRNAQVAKARAG